MALRLVRDQTGGIRQIETSQVLEQIYTRAEQARADNATYLGLAAPNTGQSTAQVQRLTRQVNALLALVLGVDDTTGT